MADTGARDFDIFKTVFYHSISLLLLPIASFFFTKLVVFEGVFKIDSQTGSIWSAIFAVVILHILLGMFIYRAYFGNSSLDSSVTRKDGKLD